MDRRKLIMTGLAAATPLAAGSLSGCATSQPGQAQTGPSYPIRSDQEAPAYIPPRNWWPSARASWVLRLRPWAA